MVFVMSSVIMLAAVQSAATNSARDAFRNCIKEAAAQAKTNKVGADAFEGFAKTHCTAQQANFIAAMWSFDAKNKVSKKQSQADADLQIEDMLVSASEKYAFEIKQ
jgi:hypothetical protein